MSIIFNEKEHVELILQKSFQTSRHKSFEMQLLATYWREQGQDDKEIENNLHLFCKQHLNNYNRVAFLKIIEEKVQKSKKRKLKVPTPINITQTELDIIMSEENLKCQKLMFVYLVLAKYYMSINHTDKYYVGCTDNDIFKLCNMYTRKQERLDFMHYLTKKGYIKPTLSMSSIVNYVNEDSETVITLIPNNDMELYFEKYLGGNIINCVCCGSLTRKKSNRTKYCKECAEKINNDVKGYKKAIP